MPKDAESAELERLAVKFPHVSIARVDGEWEAYWQLPGGGTAYAHGKSLKLLEVSLDDKAWQHRFGKLRRRNGI